MSFDPKLLIKRLVDADVVAEGAITGCSNSEIAEIESHFKLNLPQTYKQFLAYFGKNHDSFLNDLLMTYPFLIQERQQADDLLEKYQVQIPAKAFIFMIGDYQLYFFDTEAGDDPPVLFYTEGESVRQLSEHFSEWIDEAVDGEIEAVEEVRAMRAAREK